MSTFRFDAIGAPWAIDTVEPLTGELEAALLARIDDFDRTYSRFRDDSLVAEIAERPGTFTFPPDAVPLFALYRGLYEATDAAVSPLVGRTIESLGYDRTYSLRPAAIAAPVPSWDDSFAFDGRQLTTVRPVVVDVGAAGKGYLVDLIGALLLAAGIEWFTIDASGDILHRSTALEGRPLRIGLEHPLDPTKAIGIATLASGSLCASASNRRAWGDGLHHIIDAVTGLPTRSVIATWVIAPTALIADGLATALFFTEPDRLERISPFTYVRMFSTGRVDHSPDFDGELFL